MASFIFESVTPTVLKLREYRIDAGLSQTELAEAAGTTQTTISNLETGTSRRIDFGLLDRLAKALRCKPGDLFAQTRR